MRRLLVLVGIIKMCGGGRDGERREGRVACRGLFGPHENLREFSSDRFRQCFVIPAHRCEITQRGSQRLNTTTTTTGGGGRITVIVQHLMMDLGFLDIYR